MDSSENHIKQITEIVESEGYEAYDIQLSHRRNGVVRIFITAPLNNKELVPTLDACSRISRKLLDHPNVEELIPWDSTLEVSSPGVNRKIKTLNNAKGAVGERVSIKYKSEEGKNEVIKGFLLEVAGDDLLIEREVEKKKKAKMRFRVATQLQLQKRKVKKKNKIQKN